MKPKYISYYVLTGIQNIFPCAGNKSVCSRVAEHQAEWFDIAFLVF